MFLGGAQCFRSRTVFNFTEAIRSKTVDYLVSLAIDFARTSFAPYPDALAGYGANSQLYGYFAFTIAVLHSGENINLEALSPCNGEEHKFNEKMGASVPIIMLAFFSIIS